MTTDQKLEASRSIVVVSGRLTRDTSNRAALSSLAGIEASCDEAILLSLHPGGNCITAPMVTMEYVPEDQRPKKGTKQGFWLVVDCASAATAAPTPSVEVSQGPSVVDAEKDQAVVQSWSMKEQEVAANERARQIEMARREELHPTRRLSHRLVLLWRGLTVLAATNMAVGQVLGIVFESRTGPVQYVLRVYVVLLCLLTILNELEYFSMTVESRILHNWVTRGALYAFIGLLGLEENDASGSDSSSSNFQAGISYIKAVAWIMIGIGAIYFLMGLFCLQFAYDRVRLDYERRCDRAKILRDGLPQHLQSTSAAPASAAAQDVSGQAAASTALEKESTTKTA